MVKHTQTIQIGNKLPLNCLNIFDRFVKLMLKGLMAIWLPHSQLWAILKGAISLTKC